MGTYNGGTFFERECAPVATSGRLARGLSAYHPLLQAHSAAGFQNPRHFSNRTRRYVTRGLPEFVRYFLETRKIVPPGPLFRHTWPRNLHGLYNSDRPACPQSQCPCFPTAATPYQLPTHRTSSGTGRMDGTGKTYMAHLYSWTWSCGHHATLRISWILYTDLAPSLSSAGSTRRSSPWCGHLASAGGYRCACSALDYFRAQAVKWQCQSGPLPAGIVQVRLIFVPEDRLWRLGERGTSVVHYPPEELLVSCLRESVRAEFIGRNI